MAYSQNFPAQRPSFMFDAANSGRIPPNMTFTRASTGTFFGTEKVLSSENIVAYSNDISTKTLDGVTATGSQTAPDGGTDAYKLTENSATGFHRFYEQIVTNGSAITFSAYFKHIGRQWVRIRLTDSGGSDRFVWFDIQNGVAGTAETGFSGASITSSGNGYYKVSATLATSVVSGGTHYLVVEATSGDGVSGSSIAGLNADAFAVWGIQVSSTGETILNETSGSIHREYQTKLQTAASGAARFEHSATDGQSEGILIEGQSTNLTPYSQTLSSWSANVGFTVTDTAAVGPDGTLSASLLTPNTTNALHFLQDSATTVASTTYTMSAYVKAAGYTNFRLTHFQSVSPYTGTTGDYSLIGDGTATSADGTATITPLQDGWYRVTLTAAAASTTTTLRLFVLSPDPAAASFTPNEYSGIICTGVQFESGSHASSLVSTSGSAVTRASDQLSVATADIGYTGGPVSVVGEASFLSDDASAPGGYDERLFRLHKDSSNYAQSFRLASDDTIRTQVVSDGGVVATFANASTDTAANTFYKFASRIDTNNFGATLDGAAPATDTAGQLPDLNGATLYIGKSSTAGELNGHLKRIAVYGDLTDTNLQALTS